MLAHHVRTIQQGILPCALSIMGSTALTARVMRYAYALRTGTEAQRDQSLGREEVPVHVVSPVQTPKDSVSGDSMAEDYNPRH